MSKFIALLFGAADQNEKQEISPDHSNTLMQEWGKWAQANQRSIVDHGMPLGSTIRVSATGATNTKNAIVAYCIVEAADHAAAASMFREHPHLRLHKGNTIEVIEGLEIPQLS